MLDKILYPSYGNFYYVTIHLRLNREKEKPCTMLVHALSKTDKDLILEMSFARILSTNNLCVSRYGHTIGSVVKGLCFHHLGFTKLNTTPTFYCFTCKQYTTPDMLGLCPSCTAPFDFLKIYRSKKYKHLIPEEVQKKHEEDIVKFEMAEENVRTNIGTELSEDEEAEAVSADILDEIRHTLSSTLRLTNDVLFRAPSSITVHQIFTGVGNAPRN